MNSTVKQPTPNAKQQECIDNIKGKYLVLAGPGTGKTFTVMQRIKKMLESGIDASKILCLSFSNTAAGEMQNKMSKIFDKVDIGVDVYTFHAFCNEIIENYPEEFNLSDNIRIINPTITRKFFKEILEDFKPVYHKNDRNNSEGQIKQIVEKIESIKRNRLSKEDYFKNLEENPEWIPLLKTLDTEKKIQEHTKKIEKLKELWALYELYQKKMEENNYIDFNDMICMILDKFESSPLFLERIANKYEYILVDEYQDTNYVQNQIVFNLVHALKSENVFVVGDDDQIIYSFQGANLETIENFLNEFPDTKVICLKENMRSTQNILDVAMRIADEDKKRLCNNKEYCDKYNIDKKLEAKNKNLDDKKDIKVRLNKYATCEQEIISICDEIEELINSPDCPVDKDTKEKKLSEIAIILTNNDGASDFVECLKDKNIQAEVKIGKSIFKIKSSIVLYYYLQMLNQPDLYAETFSKLLLIEPFNINSKDYYKLYEGTLKGKNFLETMREKLPWVEPDKIHNFIKVYDELTKLKSSETTKNIVLEAGSRTGIFDYYFYEETNRLENIAGLKTLTDEARAFCDNYDKITLADFIEYLEMIENDRELDIQIEPLDIDMNAIQITTYHSSKGREFEYVYMPQLQKTKWEDRASRIKPTIPIKYIEGHDDQYWKQYGLSDKIKTMYVGITRAIHTLRLSYNVTTSRSKPNAWIINAQDLMEINDYTELKSDDILHITKESLTKKNYDYKRDFSDLVAERVKNDHYSPSYMNIYLQCPRKFFYDKILNLSTSKGNPDFTSYGSTMHDTFEYIVNDLLKSEKSEDEKKKQCEEFFKEKIKYYPFSSKASRQNFKERGLNELEECYRILTNFGKNTIAHTEYKINLLDEENFTGKVDLIVEKSDGTCDIYDYKTSKLATNKEFMLNEKHEDYLMQGCLYKYFYEKYAKKVNENSDKKMPELVSNVYFMFTINPKSPIQIDTSDANMKNVIGKYYESIEGIKKQEFEPCTSDCNGSKTYPCEHCSYKEFCNMDIV